jgi:hypothetical protein
MSVKIAGHDEEEQGEMVFPTDRPLTDNEKQQWMHTWLHARIIGWEAFALARALIAVGTEQDLMRGTLLLEAALTHQRCLIEFVIGRPVKNNARAWKSDLDVTPMMMSADWDPRRALGAVAVDLLQQNLTRIDRQLAHPSLERVHIATTEWDLAPSSSAIFGALSILVGRLYEQQSFYGQCLDAWIGIANQYLRESGTSLDRPILVRPASSVMFVVPAGESAGRAAALMQQAEHRPPEDGPRSGHRQV